MLKVYSVSLFPWRCIPSASHLNSCLCIFIFVRRLLYIIDFSVLYSAYHFCYLMVMLHVSYLLCLILSISIVYHLHMPCYVFLRSCILYANLSTKSLYFPLNIFCYLPSLLAFRPDSFVNSSQLLNHHSFHYIEPGLVLLGKLRLPNSINLLTNPFLVVLSFPSVSSSRFSLQSKPSVVLRYCLRAHFGIISPSFCHFPVTVCCLHKIFCIFSSSFLRDNYCTPSGRP